jgi:hypothetical protein
LSFPLSQTGSCAGQPGGYWFLVVQGKDFEPLISPVYFQFFCYPGFISGKQTCSSWPCCNLSVLLLVALIGVIVYL